MVMTKVCLAASGGEEKKAPAKYLSCAIKEE